MNKIGIATGWQPPAYVHCPCNCARGCLLVAAAQFPSWKASLALIVALALQIGVNYSNDYSDGIRQLMTASGPKNHRIGSQPRQPFATGVRIFGIAAVAGLADRLVALMAIVIGIAILSPRGSIRVAQKPYGYLGL